VFRSPSAHESGEHCSKLLGGVPPATWWFKTFHSLNTKPVLLSILLILNFFQ